MHHDRQADGPFFDQSQGLQGRSRDLYGHIRSKAGIDLIASEEREAEARRAAEVKVRPLSQIATAYRPRRAGGACRRVVAAAECPLLGVKRTSRCEVRYVSL